MTAFRRLAQVRREGLGERSALVSPPKGIDWPCRSTLAGMSTRSCQQIASTNGLESATSVTASSHLACSASDQGRRQVPGEAPTPGTLSGGALGASQGADHHRLAQRREAIQQRGNLEKIALPAALPRQAELDLHAEHIELNAGLHDHVGIQHRRNGARLPA